MKLEMVAANSLHLWTMVFFLMIGVGFILFSKKGELVFAGVISLAGVTGIAYTNAPAYLLVTECGFGELARLRFPEKNFIGMCRLCPYMKSITLESVLALLRDPAPPEVTVPAGTAGRARVAIERMFELAA